MLFPASVILERSLKLYYSPYIYILHTEYFWTICVCFINLRKGSLNYADLGVQLDVFDEQRENDESQILDVPFRGVDISSHVDVFYAILKQVSKYLKASTFLYDSNVLYEYII